MTDLVKCYRCTISYHVNTPHGNFQKCRCPECNRRFWYNLRSGGELEMNIYPEDLDDWFEEEKPYG